MFLLIIYLIFSILLSKSILKSNVFNIASLAILAYWVTYPFETLVAIQNNKVLFEAVNSIKEKGIYLYAIFGFSFLLGVFLITKINVKKYTFYPSINSKNNLFFISIFLGLLGLFCFSYTYNFNLGEYFYFTLNVTRVERMSLLTKASNALPYSIFFIPSIIALLIAIKKYGLKHSYFNSIFTLIISLINFPILFSYLLEGDRSALIKFIFVTIFTLGLTKSSVEDNFKQKYLLENFRINKKILLNRIKTILILFALILILVFISIGRNSNWMNFKNILSIQNIELHASTEFRSVNYTVSHALARKNLNIIKTEEMFTWDKIIFYPLPTYVYEWLFNEKKPPNIGDAIGIDTKNQLYGKGHKIKLGFGLSPVAEGFINLGYLGVFLIGLIYGLSIGLIQSFYNKISLERISLIDIVVLNTLGIVPLMMRSGTAGIYNWIFSIIFVLFLPLIIIDIFQLKIFK